MPRKSSPSSPSTNQTEFAFQAPAPADTLEGGIPNTALAFWDWTRPVLDNAVAHLVKGWTGGELDLSSTLIIVPTAESGRRLKQALARHAATLGGAAVVPHVWPPEMALLVPQDRRVVASALQSLLAWARVMGALRLADYAALFPHPPEQQDNAWCLSTAAMLQDLSTTLGAGGGTFASVAAETIAGEEMERWRDLAKLERLYLKALAKHQLSDAQTLKAARAAAPWLPERVERVCVLAAPDLPPLITRWVKAVAQRAPVMIGIQAPASLADAFDACGRPLPEFWQRVDALPPPLDAEQIHIAHDATKQAEKLVELLAELAPSGQTALGVCDAEVTARVKEKLAMEDVHVFEPGGVPPQSLGLWHVLQCCRDLVATGSWSSLAALLRVPEVRTALAGTGEGSGMGLLRAADDLAAKSMPVTLEHALELMKAPLQDEPATARDASTKCLGEVLNAALSLVESFNKQPLPEAVRGLLLRLYGERVFTPTSPEDRCHLELADAVLEMADTVAEEAQRFGFKIVGSEAFALVLQRVGEGSVTEPRGEVDLVLQGWLELLWESAPCVVIAGMNEENVPGILISHPFLPDGLREKLGLPCQASRFARDAYLLHAMAHQRNSNSSFHVICGQWSERGDTLRPSRLLFRCPDAELPARVGLLFPGEESAHQQSEPARSLAWQLVPRRAELAALQTISPSRIKDYLQCPFRYYLSHGLRMSSVDAGKREMGANDFGDLIHVAMQRLAEDPEAAASMEEKVIADFLEAAARRTAHARYGKRLPMLVRLQLESAVQRLRAAAAYEAQSRTDGWRIAQAEVVLGDDKDEHPLLISGARLRGKIDRVEHRHSGGRVDVRLIDFKTSDKVDTPVKAHIKVLSGRAKLRDGDEWKCFTNAAGKDCQWLDLQLPLYAAAMAVRGTTEASVGYFLMPKGVQDTTLEEWQDFDATTMQAALDCAAEVVRRINDGIFWPPAKVKFDAYEALLLGDAQAAVKNVFAA